MANKNPIASQSDRNPLSKGNDKQDDDEFEDSLNISISEHISEEIENDDSNITSAEDSIEKSKRDLDLSKRRQLFDIGNDDDDAIQPREGSMFSKFEIDDDLSGENIAQHFRVVDNPPANEPSTEINVSGHSLSLKITEEKSSEVEAALDYSVGDVPSAMQMQSIAGEDEMGRDESDGAAAAASGEENDVILINDHEVSIHTLKKQQTQQPSSHSASDPNASANQNTTSDISDLLNENSVSQQKDEIQVKSVSQSDEDKSKLEAAKSTVVIENASIEPEIETIEEKQQEIKEIISKVVDKLPIDKTLAPVQAATVAHSATTTDSEQPASTAVTEIDYESRNNRLFERELDANLIHMQEKIRELQNIAAGKYQLDTVLNLPVDFQAGPSSRPQSGRESTSITTNSTEYKTFPEEYFQLTDLQVALHNRDQIIQDLNASLKQSLQIRDLLADQSERLSNEVKQLRAIVSSSRGQWQSVGEGAAAVKEQRLSETTIDLVSESDFDDDEYFKKPSVPLVAQPSVDEAKVVVEPEQTPDVSLPQTAIEEFKKNLTTDELKVFITMQNKFNEYLHQELEAIGKSYALETQEKNEKEGEINRLQQLVVNMKTGSAEVKELRHELDVIHKKEMEDLRMYFERKCTDLEKQYSEEVFSQHSRRHSNDTNSDLSDGEIFLPDETAARRKSKAGEILASPTHRKITPTNISGAASLSSPKRAPSRGSQHNSTASSNSHKESAIEHLHDFYRKQIADLKRSHDEIIKQLNYKLQSRQSDDEYTLTKTAARSDELTNAKLLKNTINNENNEMFTDLVHEYDRRLEEQVKLAKADMLNELEIQIKTLLSETAPEESRWPPELILLREKFTAKSQLEIAQLQIKHEEEMSRLKTDYEKQMNRKLKRHLNFDDGRDLEKTALERDNLRELCNIFRHLLYELAKCVSVCDVDLNATLAEELNKYDILQKSNSRPVSPSASANESADLLNQSTCSSMRVAFVPDVSGILSLIDDPSLVNFVTEQAGSDDDAIDLDGKAFNLNECLEKLKSEADSLLQLSENLVNKRVLDNRDVDRNQSIEEGDGLKSRKFSNNGVTTKDELNSENGNQKQRLSLPLYLPVERKGTTPELNEVKNRLVLAERKKQELENELAASIAEQNRLNEELRLVTIKLNNYIDGHSEELSEGYGISQLRSPQRQPANKSSTSFTALQERAKQYFNDTTSSENVSQLLQLIEDFCREGDKLIEEEKQIKKDLQEQIEAADKQRKQDLKFLDEQAAEREVERDEFSKEMEKLRAKLRDKEKDRVSYESYVEESKQFEEKIRELTATIETLKTNISHLQSERKMEIDKIYDLRTIITDLELEVEEKNSKLRALEIHMNNTTTANESLQHEVESLKTQTETAPVYEETIKELEEQIRCLQPNAEQSAVIERIAGHLREIEENLDRKTNLLESIHVMQSEPPTSCSTPSEDVSIRGSANNLDGAIISPRNLKYLAKDPAFPIDQILRITEKLQKHTKVEEAAIKRVRDLEMQIKALHSTYVEIQGERDLLQEKMSEQIMRISSIQSRLDEQRQRAEELQRAGTSDLNLKMYDLQTELTTLKETLSARDKQINVLKNHLTQSKEIIDKQEMEIALATSTSAATTENSRLDKLMAEIEAKNLENKNLRDKMRTEMITKVALPDLMETMLAEKTDEIEFLKEQLEARENELKSVRERQLLGPIEEKFSFKFAKDSGSSVNEYEGNDHTRRLPEAAQDIVTSTFNMEPGKYFSSHETPKEPEIVAEKSRSLNYLHEQTEFSDLTPPPNPRKIIFTSKSTIETNATNPNQNTFEIEALQQKIDEISKERDELRQIVESHESKLNAVETEKKQLSDDIQSKRELIRALETKIATKENELTALTTNYDQKCDDYESLNEKLTAELGNIEVMKQQLESLNNTVQRKDEILANYSANGSGSNSETLQRQLQEENERLKEILAETERELSEKMIGYEKCLLDIDEHKNTIYHLNDVLTDSKSARSVEEMRIEIRNYRDANDQLKEEIEDMKNRLYRTERSTSPTPKQFSIDEITDRVEQELNYSAQLDSSIRKAIESDDVASDHNRDGTIASLRIMCRDLEKANAKLRETLDAEQKKFASIREQDAECIETMTHRLEAALEQEAELNHLLDDERAKTAQLSTKILEHQFERSKMLSSSELLLTSPLTSPRRQKSIDFDQEVVKRLSDEIKLLKSQVEREKERSEDMEKSLLREKNRFEIELSEQKSYGEGMKHEIDRVIAENQELQNELDAAQDRLAASARDIENLQIRIQNLQEADGYRVARSEKERNELAQNATALQNLQSTLNVVERERDLLKDRVSILQKDIERGAQREARLTESLAGVAGITVQNQSNGLMLPQQQLLNKLKEMNEHLSENVRENRQLSETLQFLTDERQMLQKRVFDLEQACCDRDELEEKANHLFGKYLRTESFRRALVHQKRYLMIVLSTYEANEAKVLSLVHNNQPAQPKRRKITSFKSLVLVAIAIERMKYILRRWHTGKRVGAKAILPNNMGPRRTHSASTINWNRSAEIPLMTNILHQPQSPPSRDRPSVLKGRRSNIENNAPL